MVKHICEKCLKEFKQKGHLTKHLNKKNPCKLEKDLKQIVNEAVEDKLKEIIDQEIKINSNVKWIKNNKEYTGIVINKTEKNYIIKNGEKNNRIKHKDVKLNNKYTIIETFVGCGGSHLGFKKNGFETIFVNDIWKTSLDTLSENNKELDDNQIICNDINNLCKEDLLSKYNIEKGSLTLLVGGVVCKGFSLAGVRNPYDIRNYLYLSQLKLVEQFMPKISIIENVPGMENMNILYKKNYAPISKKLQLTDKSESIEILCKELDDIIVNFKSNRGQIIAINKKLNILETNTLDNRKIKEKLEEEKLKIDKLRSEYEEKLDKYKYGVVNDIIERYLELGYKIYKKKLKVSNYGGYTNRVRLIIVAVRNDIKKEWEWPKITNDDDEVDLPNLYTVKDAFNLLDAEKNDIENDKDNIPMNHKKTTIEKFKKITHDKKSTGFSSRGTSHRLDYNKPAPTLVPGHSSFQIHPEHHRSITVREGATITGFPIDYKFSGSHSDRCMQIGNAIPVHLSDAIAKSVIEILK